MVYALKGFVQHSGQKSRWKGGLPVATSCAPHSPLVAPNDPIVEWDGQFAEKEDLAFLPELGHVRVQILGRDHVEGCRAEVSALSDDKWEGVFDLAAPTPSPFRTAVMDLVPSSHLKKGGGIAREAMLDIGENVAVGAPSVFSAIA